MQAGVYTFCHKLTGKYLSCTDRTLRLDAAPWYWQLKPAPDGGFYIYAHGTQLLLDIHNAQVVPGTLVKLWTYTAYDVQIWKLLPNKNGTYSICYCSDPKYCLGFLGGDAQLQFCLPGSAMQEWVVTEASSQVSREVVSVTGQRRTVTIELACSLAELVSQQRLYKWVNDLETAYETFCRLTNFRPFPCITVECYLPPAYPSYMGWVFPGTDTIHINREHFVAAMHTLRNFPEDWNFCVLHEMGHMFDTERPWNFEPELLTDLKVAYVLEKNNASAVLAEFGGDTMFRGAEIAEAYRRLGGDLSEKYEIFACATRFLDIKDRIGWQPFLQTFHTLQADHEAYRGISRRKNFDLFMGGLSHYSGENLRGWFSDAEWASILRYLEE